MKIVIINKSDSTGGAAIVSRRLMEAFRREGEDARMLVCEKLTDSPYVELAATPSVIKRKFLIERLKIFISNGFNRKTLFKIDTGEVGLPLWKHPLVKEADAILLNWVNQGMLSLKGVERILKLGKPVIWTMHDMWNMTGICHHAGSCTHYLKNCGNCPYLGKKSNPKDLSNKIWFKKEKIYCHEELIKKTVFVAVSNWLKEKALESSLLKRQKVVVIPNAFPISSSSSLNNLFPSLKKIRILFGAARLDDPIKGLDTLKETSKILKENYPDVADKLKIVFFGDIKNPKNLDGFEISIENLGILHGEDALKKAYFNSQILVSASSYETLSGTLVEAQAYGCIPVSFDRGGQSDIIDHLLTGYLAQFNHDIEKRASNLAEGIVWATGIINDEEKYQCILRKMRENVCDKFSYASVVGKYIQLINEL